MEINQQQKEKEAASIYDICMSAIKAELEEIKLIKDKALAEVDHDLVFKCQRTSAAIRLNAVQISLQIQIMMNAAVKEIQATKDTPNPAKRTLDHLRGGPKATSES